MEQTFLASMQGRDLLAELRARGRGGARRRAQESALTPALDR